MEVMTRDSRPVAYLWSSRFDAIMPVHIRVIGQASNSSLSALFHDFRWFRFQFIGKEMAV